MAIETILISTLLPAVVDLFKNGLGAVTRKFVGISTEDQIKLDNSQVERLKALAELDNPHGTPSQWVIDLRASYRYIAATILIAIGSYTIYLASLKTSTELFTIGAELVGMPFGFIFGERLYLGLKGNFSK